MKTADFCEISVNFCQITLCHIPEDSNLFGLCSESLIFDGATSCIHSYNESQWDALFLKFILVKNSACFGQLYCPSSGILLLYSQQ